MNDNTLGMRRTLAGGAAGWLGMLIWSGVFWGFLYKPVGVFQDANPAVGEAAAILARANVPEGTHFFPWPRDTPEARSRWLAAHRSGPVMEMHWVPSGADSEAPSKFLAGMLQYAIVAAGLAWLARRVRRLGGTHKDLLACLVVVPVVAVTLIDLAPPIWFDLPWHHFLTLALHDAVALALLAAAVFVAHRSRSAA